MFASMSSERQATIKALAVVEAEERGVLKPGIPDSDIELHEVILSFKDRGGRRTISIGAGCIIEEEPTSSAAAAAAGSHTPPTPGSPPSAAASPAAAAGAGAGAAATAAPAAAADASAEQQQQDMDCQAAGDVPSQPYIIDDPAETEEVEQAAALHADVESSELSKRKSAETGAQPKIIEASSSSYACTIKAYYMTAKHRSSKPWQLFLNTPETAAANRAHKYLCTISEEGLQQLQDSFSQRRAEGWEDVQRRVEPFVRDSVRQRLAGMA